MSDKHTYRQEDLRKSLMHRLSRIEGQVRGVRRMLEEETYCVDILTQVAAIRAALKGFSRELLDSHVRGCVKDGIVRGEDAVVEELLDTIHKIMK